MYNTFWRRLFFGLLICNIVESRIHRFSIQNDARRRIQLSYFGFLRGGALFVQLSPFTLTSSKELTKGTGSNIRLTLIKSQNAGVSRYLSQDAVCNTPQQLANDATNAVVDMRLDPEHMKLDVMKGSFGNADLDGLAFNYDYFPVENTALINTTDDICKSGEPVGRISKTRTNCACNSGKPSNCSTSLGNGTVIPITGIVDGQKKQYNISFEVSIISDLEEGLYVLNLHNCEEGDVRVSFSALINERNVDNYLSAGDIALPWLYTGLFAVYLALAAFWTGVLYQRRQNTFRTHLIMLVLVFVKSFTLLFHAVNYYYIAKEGRHELGWAIIYYVTYLLKGALLFVSIILIGAGWSLIKHILSKREKKIFAIVVPLQILANVAYIIIEEEEQAIATWATWQQILVLVDLICCGAILFPIIWSIKHLQEASQADGKAATSLHKLTIFRHFYVMTVAYIYVTRIISYFLNVTVPFDYTWTVELAREIATLVFYTLTGYWFRPTASPSGGVKKYQRVPQEEDGEDNDETGEIVIMDQFSVQDALRVSSALPTVIPMSESNLANSTPPSAAVTPNGEMRSRNDARSVGSSL